MSAHQKASLKGGVKTALITLSHVAVDDKND
jgi:hypothetical protein